MMLSTLILLCLVAAGTSKPTVESIALPQQPTVKVPATTANETPVLEAIDDTVIVLEKATPFAEKINFDHATGCETLHVPAHNGMYEANIMHCFNQVRALPTS
ncbi:uncharacterized protein LOC118411176 [Branchiostoma floridae]|uniref:Uncharacterized protein LOC118411176 n=1 Tax=Branchiostoma floridae TaxID=7739 RepID=A0A9J7KS66_BRAFL|nr:uncharacterized protein LOC118411176 [Branchiostoma floridae]